MLGPAAGGGDADGDHGAVAHAPRLGNRGRGATIAPNRRGTAFRIAHFKGWVRIELGTPV